MKISVVTAVMNGRSTITDMLKSLHAQSHHDIEHIIQDGGSTDGTLDVLRRQGLPNTDIVSCRDTGIYDAINKGIRRATGDVVGLLHADDRLASPDILADVAAAFKDEQVDGVYGDLQYVARDNAKRVIRHWKAGNYTRTSLRRGWMPPHPTLYLRRAVFDRVGLYDTSYRISGDYDGILRFLTAGHVRLAYLPEVMVQMKMGGISNRNFAHIIRKSREDYRAIRQNHIGGISTLLSKNVSKLGQFRGSGVEKLGELVENRRGKDHAIKLVHKTTLSGDQM